MGFYWHIGVVGNALRLPISVLEFVAIGVNLIAFAPLVGKARPILYSDSLNAVQVLNEFSADSELMQFTHRKVLALPEYQRLAQPTSFIHCYGPANPCADAVSRGRFELLFQLFNQMGVAPVQVEVPLAARELLSEVCEFAERNGLLSDGPRRHLHSTSVELGAAAQVANGFGHLGTIGREVVSREACTRGVKRSRTDHTVRKPEMMQRQRLEPTPRPQPRLVSTHQRSTLSTMERTRAVRCHPVPVARLVHHHASTAPVKTTAGQGRHERDRTNCGDSPDAQKGKIGANLTSLARTCQMPRRLKGRDRLYQAIETRTLQLVDKLASDMSPLALRPNDATKLHGLCAAHIATAQSVPAMGTLDADGTAWRRWVDYCEGMGTPPLRATAGRSPF